MGCSQFGLLSGSLEFGLRTWWRYGRNEGRQAAKNPVRQSRAHQSSEWSQFCLEEVWREIKLPRFVVSIFGYGIIVSTNRSMQNATLITPNPKVMNNPIFCRKSSFNFRMMHIGTANTEFLSELLGYRGCLLLYSLSMSDERWSTHVTTQRTNCLLRLHPLSLLNLVM